MEAGLVGGPAASRDHQLRGADGTVRPDGLARALAQAQRNRDASRGIKATALSWHSRGPNDVGGRARGFAIDPRNPNVLYIGGVTGGVWKSNDRGVSWQSLADFMPNLNIGALAIDPHAPDTLYAGTGESHISANFGGSGVFRTDDGGASWRVLPGTTSWASVNRIVISPADRQVLFVTTRGGIRKSTDGGTSWRTVYPAWMGWDLEIDPTNAQTVLATSFDLWTNDNDHGWSSVGYHHVLRSTDGGEHWSVLYEVIGYAVGRFELAFAPSGSGVVYGIGAIGYNQPGVFLQSTDHGASFAVKPAQFRDYGGAPTQPILDAYYCFLWVSPQDDHLVVLGGLVLFRSRDGGSTFDLIYTKHPDHHLAVADVGYGSGGNRRVYLLSDGGLHYAPDITAPDLSWESWQPLDDHLVTSQFYGGCGAGPTNTIAGGTQDNGGWLLRNGSRTGSSYVLAAFGDVGRCAFDPADPNRFYATDGGVYGLGRIDVSAFAAGLPGSSVDIRPPAGNSATGDNPGDEFAAWNPYIVLDPNDPRRMYVAHHRLWVSNDVRTPAHPTWRSILEASTGRPPIYDNFTAIAVAPGDSNQVWVADGANRLFHTSNALSATPTWTAVDDNAGANPLPNRAITALWADRFDTHTLYVALGGFEPDNLYRTRNGGVSWEVVAGSGALSLPEAPIYAITQHPSQRNDLYVGTEVGVFSSFDGGKTWIAAPSGPANVIVYDLNFLTQSNLLLAATFGRGLWTLDTGSIVADGTCNADDTTLCVGGGRYLVRASWQDGQGHGGDGHAHLLGADTGYFWFFDAGNVELILKVLDGCGITHKKWIFAAGLTNLRVDILVIDTRTGASHVYHNAPGQPFQPILDLDGLDACGAAGTDATPASGIEASAASLTAAPLAVDESLAGDAIGACTPSDTALCLYGGRFRVETTWRTSAGASGSGHAVALTADTGYFWFFDAGNVEEVIKSLSGCGINNRFWIFAAGLTNVEVTTRVTDTGTGAVKVYHNAQGQPFQPILDVDALSCP